MVYSTQPELQGPDLATDCTLFTFGPITPLPLQIKDLKAKMDEMCVSDWGHVLHYSVNLTSLNFLKGVSPPPPLDPHMVNLVLFS